MNPSDLSTKDLKELRKLQLETIEFANSQDITIRANMVISMVDAELETRGIDTKKMFKTKQP